MTAPKTTATSEWPPSIGELESWAEALHHLAQLGVPGIPPARVLRSLAALPERYGALLDPEFFQ